jgi:hypothetical protein
VCSVLKVSQSLPANEPKSPWLTSELTSEVESRLAHVAEGDREDDDGCGARGLVCPICWALVLDVASERPFEAADLPALGATTSGTEEAVERAGLIGFVAWNARDCALTGREANPLSCSSVANR